MVELVAASVGGSRVAGGIDILLLMLSALLPHTEVAVACRMPHAVYVSGCRDPNIQTADVYARHLRYLCPCAFEISRHARTPLSSELFASEPHRVEAVPHDKVVAETPSGPNDSIA